MNLCDESTIRALLERHGFHFSKSMGQNFLIDPEIPARIAASSEADEHCGVLEIGPGIGPLTAELAQRAGKVVSVELDRSLLPILAETMAAHPNVEIVPGDVMRLDLSALIAEKFQGLRPIVCANLPYNITTPVITQLLECGAFRSITVMIQKEVAKRICAAPGTADFGAFSLLCQYYAHCEYLFEVSRECFLPAPKVTSAVVKLDVLDKPPVEVQDEAMLFRVIRAAFAQRRKTLSNALSAGFGELTKEQINGCISASGLAPQVRGEKLGLAEFARLADAVNSL